MSDNDGSYNKCKSGLDCITMNSFDLASRVKSKDHLDTDCISFLFCSKPAKKVKLSLSVFLLSSHLPFLCGLLWLPCWDVLSHYVGDAANTG